MASDPAKTPRGSWKLAAPSAEPKRSLEPRWRRLRGTGKPSTLRPHWTRAAKLGVGTLAFLAVAALLAASMSMVYLPPPVCVVPIGAAYEDNLAVPHNVYGW